MEALDVAELARGGGGVRGEFGARGDRESFVERCGGFLVASTRRVHQRATKRD